MNRRAFLRSFLALAVAPVATALPALSAPASVTVSFGLNPLFRGEIGRWDNAAKVYADALYAQVRRKSYFSRKFLVANRWA